MQSKAFNKIANLTDNDSMSSVHNTHVISVSTGVVKSFVVSSQPRINRHGELETLISTQAIPAPSYLVNQTSVAWNQYKEKSSKLFVPIESGFESAWSITQNTSNRSRLDDWLEENHSINYWSRQISSTFGGALWSPLAGTEWEIVFSDDSSLIMVASTTTSSRLKLSYKAMSAEDADGNRIPDAGMSVQGEYTFSNERNLSNFLGKLSRYGIRYVVVHSGSVGGRKRVTITDISRY
ncbi:hypothetical protein [Pseudoalteromonas ostreae]|uniref:hypothetical protein n=1 Tax=Pseudoalteromonas ostreae TaxID=2774154 RepID=UPI001B383F63|nr:hypothetical protein [Pseudoalteromonas ostreae]